MFDLFRENPRKSALILLIPVCVAALYLIFTLRWSIQQNDGYVGALLDDTWIHVRFAQHLAEGKGLSYNEGVVTPGATSPLWVLVLGAVYAIVNPEIAQQVHIAVVLSAVGGLLAVLAITAFGWWVTRRAWLGLLAGMITALTGRFVWMGLSGMEITTFTMLSVVALWSHVHDVQQDRVFGWRTGILAALATLARPEGYLLAALLLVDDFFLIPLSHDRFSRIHLWAGWRGILAYVLLAGSYPLFCLLVSGHPLPNTFRVKSQFGREFPQLPEAYFWQPNVDHSGFFSALMVIGTLLLLWQARRERTGFAWGLWHPAFVLGVLLLGAQNFVVNNSRYVAPAIPFHALAASVGVMWVSIQIMRFVGARHVSSETDNVVGTRHGDDFLTRPHPPAPSPLRREGEQHGFFKSPLQALGRGFRGGVRKNTHDRTILHTYHRRATLQWIATTLGILLVVLTFWLGRDQSPRVASDTAKLRQMHMAAGEWVREVTQPGQVIALNDVGAIVHISDRPVLDMVGLVSPEVLEVIRDVPRFTCAHDLALSRLMLDDPPVFIGIFPWFFPCLTSNWGDALQPYNVFAITGTTVIAGGEMVFYWPLWENWPLQSQIPPDTIPVAAQFDQGIQLAAYTSAAVDQGLQVTLWWTADAPPEGDYTIFLHLIDPDGNILAQKDSRPQDGRMNTIWWQTGDIILDTRIIEVGAVSILQRNDLALRIGLYETGGTVRLLRAAAPIGEEEFVIIPLTGD